MHPVLGNSLAEETAQVRLFSFRYSRPNQVPMFIFQLDAQFDIFYSPVKIFV